MSRAGVAEAARAAASFPVTEGAGTVSAVVRLFGHVVGLSYTPDRAEVARRTAVGLGSITRGDVVEALMGLPLGLPVAFEDVSPGEQQLLRSAPAGVLDVEAGCLIRRAVAPLVPRMAIVAARGWREGLVRAGRFAPFCARAMLLPAAPKDLDDARVEASFYGIGLWVIVAGELRRLVDAEPFVRTRHSSGQWSFDEEIHRQVIGSRPTCR